MKVVPMDNQQPYPSRPQNADPEDPRRPQPRRRNIFRLRNLFVGFKLSNFVLTLTLGVIITFEIKIMYDTTRTYNTSLVKTLSEENGHLKRVLLNNTATHNERNEMSKKIFQIIEEAEKKAENRTKALNDKMDENLNLLIQLNKKVNHLEESVNAVLIESRRRKDKDSKCYGTSSGAKVPSSSLASAFGFTTLIIYFLKAKKIIPF